MKSSKKLVLVVLLLTHLFPSAIPTKAVSDIKVCQVRINEVFGDLKRDWESIQNYYIELEGICTKGTSNGFSLAGHKLVFVNPPTGQKPTEIWGVVSLHNEKLNNNGFYTIGGANVVEKTKSFSDGVVKLRQEILQKAASGTRRITSLFGPAQTPNPQSDSPYAILLLKGEPHIKSDIKNIKMEAGGDHVVVTAAIEKMLKDLVVDGVVLGKQKENSCSVFSRMCNFKTNNYIIPYLDEFFKSIPTTPTTDSVTRNTAQIPLSSSNTVNTVGSNTVPPACTLRTPSTSRKDSGKHTSGSTQNLRRYFPTVTRRPASSSSSASGGGSLPSSSSASGGGSLPSSSSASGGGSLPSSSSESGGSNLPSSSTTANQQQNPQGQIQNCPSNSAVPAVRTGEISSSANTGSGGSRSQPTGQATGTTGGSNLETRATATNQAQPTPTPRLSPVPGGVVPASVVTNPSLIPMSINRCTATTNAFTPEVFKLAKRTPNAKNDCDNGSPIFVTTNRRINIDEGDVGEESAESVCVVPQINMFVETGINTLISYGNQINKETPIYAPRVLLSADTGSNMPIDNMEAERLQYIKNFIPHSVDAAKQAEMKLQETAKEAAYSSMLRSMERHQPTVMPLKHLREHKNIYLPWLEYLPNANNPAEARLRCSLCYQYGQTNNDLSLGTMPDMAKENGGLGTGVDANRKMLQRHLKESQWHLHVVEKQKIKEKEQLKASVGTALEREYQKLTSRQKSTAQMMHIIYAENRMHVPFNGHETMVKLLKSLGVSLGNHHNKRLSVPRFLRFFSSKMHEALLKHMTLIPKPFGIILDTATDRIGNDLLVILLQSIEANRPVVYFYKIVEVGVDSSAQGYLATVKRAFEEDLTKYRISLWDHAKTFLKGITTDGAAVFYGRVGGMGVLLSKELKGNPETLYRTHCMAHRLQLAGRKLVTLVNQLENFEDDIKQIAKFYNNQHPKNIAHMDLLSRARNEPAPHITYAFVTRWADSEKVVLQKLRKSYSILVMDLESINQDSNMPCESQATAGGLLGLIKNRRFVLMLHFMSDILNALAAASLYLQTSGGLIIGKHFHIQGLKQTIADLKENDGAHMKILMTKLKCPTADRNGPCRSSRHVESAERVILRQAERLDDITLAELPRTPRGASPSLPFSEVKNTIIDTLVDQLNQYFPEEVSEEFDVLLPKNIAAAKEDGRLLSQTYGLGEICQLASRFGLESMDTIDEWKALWYTFIQRDDFDLRVTKDTDVVQFWPALLNDATLTFGNNLRSLIQTILVLPSSSADAERAFSVMNNIKSIKRTTLTLNTLNDQMRVNLNGPRDISDFPYYKFAAQWAGVHVNDPSKLPGPKRAGESPAGGPALKRPFTIEASNLQQEELAQQELERGEIGESEMDIEIDESEANDMQLHFNELDEVEYVPLQEPALDIF